MFRYYNANPLGRCVNDCSVRAISLATNRTWDETYAKLAHFAREQGITFSEVEFIDDYLADQFEKLDRRDWNIETLGDFLDLNLRGRWLVTMAGHITCVVDGVCYDTFDPSDRIVWSIYKVE